LLVAPAGVWLYGEGGGGPAKGNDGLTMLAAVVICLSSGVDSLSPQMYCHCHVSHDRLTVLETLAVAHDCVKHGLSLHSYCHHLWFRSSWRQLSSKCCWPCICSGLKWRLIGMAGAHCRSQCRSKRKQPRRSTQHSNTIPRSRRLRGMGN
jgi:hypothetical protein